MQIDTKQAAVCEKCGHSPHENFCPNCSERRSGGPIDAKFAKRELLQLAGVEAGLLYTIRKLLVAPGKCVRNYIEGDRGSFTKPVSFLIATSVIYTVISHYFSADEILETRFQSVYGNSNVGNVMQWIQENYAYANLLMMVFIAGFLKLFFVNRAYNIFEIAVMLCFVVGEGMILICGLPILTKYANHQLAENLYALLIFLYVSWAIGQFFGGRISDHVKSFAAYFLGFIAFETCGFAIGILLDVLSR